MRGAINRQDSLSTPVPINYEPKPFPFQKKKKKLEPEQAHKLLWTRALIILDNIFLINFSANK